MYSELKDMKVIGMAAAVSNTWDSVREFSTEDEAVINKFIKTTGVEGRYSANPRQCTSDFCFAAAEKILAEKKSHGKRSEFSFLLHRPVTIAYHLLPVCSRTGLA